MTHKLGLFQQRIVEEFLCNSKLINDKEMQKFLVSPYGCTEAKQYISVYSSLLS